MENKKIHITDLGHKHLFIEAAVSAEIFVELLKEFKQKGFFVIGARTGNH
jgi:predicted ABC-type ATPase